MCAINPNLCVVIIRPLEPWTSALVSWPQLRGTSVGGAQRGGGGATGQRRGRREEGRENPKGPEGREGGRARAGNRGYLQLCPWAEVGPALAGQAAEPAAPPCALGHPGSALAGGSCLARSPRPGGGSGRSSRAVTRPRERTARGAGARAAGGPQGESRPRRGCPGAGWARTIAKGCGLAKIAEPRGERVQEGGERGKGKHKPRAG